MNRETLVARLTPIANDAKTSMDPDVLSAHVVLCALLGCLDPALMPEPLAILTTQAGLICEHMVGRHACD